MVIIIQWILIIMGILGVVYVIQENKEGFVTTIDNNYGRYPCSVDQPLLQSYPKKKNWKQLSKNTYEQNSLFQPMTKMSSYSQLTNNIRFWETPDESSCSPADFCNTIYNKKNIMKRNPKFAGIYDRHRVNMFHGI
jgi:hypothetical protein